ncbi:hypothetical protein BDY17DRAFT_310330 [Neohortaea acidophila]|uniref:Putative gamma-glutamylcyclotransferase n=1 Tax=Neohortaea acidophila TaxID=245834 RepID=A0A6A6PT59_9PEZI|nr:uncharacterized protein BDY17DRAFT_310330 [Neohortaea acidophila]KAF2483289.1 hypothetical protein BDY17DRAFT_310330 [Neohortaea acidophila]
MDALDILEAMAANANYDAETDDAETMEKWQRLFGYSAEEARMKIDEQRDDLTSMVSAALWDAVREQQEALGHDRETYSHWLRIPRTASSQHITSGTTANVGAENGQSGQEYLLRLDGPISCAHQVAEITGLTAAPKLFEGASERDGTAASFCKVDAATKQSILTWTREHHPTFRPMFVMRSLARKEFDITSISPTLGQDATLPQYRFTTVETSPRPAQAEYPVWYFFYGTLASQQTLHSLLQHLDGDDYDLANYELRPARVAGAKLTIWGNKYKALVDGNEEDVVEGWAFLVKSELHEEALRSYETSAYEVVRCRIICGAGCDGEVLLGCTFRLAKR